jgi:uncharacterized protein involved in outer membrane biogenesis
MKILKKILIWFVGILLGIILLLSGALYFFQDKLIAAAVNEINKYLSVKVEINPDIEVSWWKTFPNVSVHFRDVKIHESVPGSDSLMGEAGEVYLAFHTWQLLRGEYEIQKLEINNGDFKLRVTDKGIRNFLILKEDTSSGSGGSKFNITNITGHNVRIAYRDQRDGQVYSFVLEELHASLNIDSLRYRITLESSNKVEEISVANTSFLGGKSASTKGVMIYEPESEIFTLEPSEIELEEALFSVAGYVDLKQSKLDLKIDNKKSDVKALISLLPASVYNRLKSYKSSGNIYLNSTFTGNYGPTQNPAIDVKFGFENVNLVEPDLKVELKAINLSGHYSNGRFQNVSSSVLDLKNISAVLENEKVKGNLRIENFNDPFLKFDFSGKLYVAWLLKVLQNPELKSGKGKLSADLTYEGKVSALKSQNIEAIKASGELSLDSVYLNFKSLPYNLSSANGILLFNNSDVAVDDFRFRLGKSDFSCSGFMKNVLPRFVNGEKRMLADLAIESDFIDVEELLASDTTASGSKPQGKFPYLDPYVFKIQLNANRIVYKKVDLTKVKGAFRFDQPYMDGSKVSFQMAGGKVDFDASTIFHSENEIQTSLKSKLSDLQIDSIFYMFDDFGQSFMGQKNLKGKFSGTVDAMIFFDKNGVIDTKKLVANIDGTIKEGELNNFEPMQNLSKFIDANELAHIKFKELQNKIFIKDRIITLPEMRIVSNVSNISIAGTHSFDNLMDYQLAVPLKNLRQSKINKEESEGAVEEDQKQGTTVFLTIKGTPDNYKIAYDTKRTGKKIKEDLKKEKQEFIDLFKKQKEEVKEVKPDKNEFFEWE